MQHMHVDLSDRDTDFIYSCGKQMISF